MSVKFKFTALAGALALAMGGTAMANTTLTASSPTGDVWINVVDATNNTSFLYDTGVSLASFNGAGSYTYNFTGDANYAAFVGAEGGSDVIDYSVLAGTKSTATPAVGTVLFTSNQNPGPVIGTSISNALTNANGFLSLANGVTSTTTNSVTLGSSNTWGQVAYEQTVSTNLGVQWTQPGTGVGVLAGTAASFYDEASNALRSGSTFATITQLAGTWNFNAVTGIATYGSSAPVPLPTPLLLLLSGVGLMGVVARRNKSEAAV
jgi:hypothetical protein